MMVYLKTQNGTGNECTCIAKKRAETVVLTADRISKNDRQQTQCCTTYFVAAHAGHGELCAYISLLTHPYLTRFEAVAKQTGFHTHPLHQLLQSMKKVEIQRKIK